MKGVGVGLLCLVVRVTSIMIFSLAVTTAYGQFDPALPKLAPVSPNAAALGKFGEIPVGYYTGIPNVSVPLYVLTAGDLQIPVSIDYHAGGIKVEEMASSVGLGWALNAGGVITRSQRGLPDEMDNGFLSTRDSILALYNNAMGNPTKYRYEISQGLHDSEADIFYFNAGGLSGKFTFTNDGEIVTIPRSDISVILLNDGPLSTWKIIDGQGNQYFFTSVEQSTVDTFFASSPLFEYNNDEPTTTATSWYLTRVVSPKQDTIQISYQSTGTSYRTKNSETRNVSLMYNTFPSCPPDETRSYGIVTVQSAIPLEISSRSGKVAFEMAGGPHLDIVPLKRIYALNHVGDTVKRFDFYTSHFEANVDIGGCEDNMPYRLRLDSIQEFGVDHQKIPPHKFGYNALQLPCRLSNAQDYWGYYNGKDNQSFVEYRIWNGPLMGAIKAPDSAFTKASMLESITYPTGGSTLFQFEGNTRGVYKYGFDFDDPKFVAGHLQNNSTGGDNPTVVRIETFNVDTTGIGPNGKVKMKVRYQLSNQDPSILGTVQLLVENVNGSNLAIDTDGLEFELTPGTYTLYGSITTEFVNIPYIQYVVEIDKIPFKHGVWEEKSYGGLRIRSISTFEDNGKRLRYQRFDYRKVNVNGCLTTPSVSSGVAMPIPNYNYVKTSVAVEAPTVDGHSDGILIITSCVHETFNCVSNYPLTLANGKPIGYQDVTVLEGGNGHLGKTVYSYSNYLDNPDYPGNQVTDFPFPPTEDHEWRRGLLIRQHQFAFVDNKFKLVQSKRIYYESSNDSTTRIVRSVKQGALVQYNMQTTEAVKVSGMVKLGYTTRTEGFNMLADTTIVYDQADSTQRFITASSYQYNKKNFQVASESKTESNGETTIVKTKYPLDYSLPATGNSAAQGLNLLQQKHMISVPVERFQVRKLPNNDKIVTAGLVTKYRNDLPLPDSIFWFESSQPIAYDDFDSTYMSNTGSPSLRIFRKDQHYKSRISFSKYDDRMNVLEQSKVNDVLSAFLWDARRNVIASVANAKNDDIAYTSFEAEKNEGNWVFSATSVGSSVVAKTGTKYFNISTTQHVSRSTHSACRYILEYSAKAPLSISVTNATVSDILTMPADANGWVPYKKLITTSAAGTITLAATSGSTKIDELRMYPQDAQMTTYTYLPLIGLSSVTDPNGISTYYTYDNMRRLSFIVDDKNNVLKKYSYNYRIH
jgi:hypothetical protein